MFLVTQKIRNVVFLRVGGKTMLSLPVLKDYTTENLFDSHFQLVAQKLFIKVWIFEEIVKQNNSLELISSGCKTQKKQLTELGTPFSIQRCFNRTISHQQNMHDKSLRKLQNGQRNYITPKLKWVLSVARSTAWENVVYCLLSFSTCSLLRAEL